MHLHSEPVIELPNRGTEMRGYHETRLRNGINWFYWIAGLSLFNSVVFHTSTQWSFTIGLALTQFIDGLAAGLGRETGSPGVATAIALGLDVLVAGVFAALGYLGRQRYRWVVVAGMAVYLLDGVLMLVATEWLSAAFHAFALFGLWRGLQALLALRRLDADSAAASFSAPVLMAPAAQSDSALALLTPQRLLAGLLIGLSGCLMLAQLAMMALILLG